MEEPAETVIPILDETLRITKRQRETGRVRVSVTTGEERRMVEEVLRQRSVDVERVPVGRPVAEAPPVREEGDTLIIPVLEEVLVVERRLVLREEVRLRLRTEERRESAPVTLRRQDVAVERLPPIASAPVPYEREINGMRTITGLFDSRPEAEHAVEQMVQEYKLDRDRIQVHAAGTENATAGTFDRRSESHHGFLSSLRDLFLPEGDRASYAEGVRRGGILVSAQVPDEMVGKISDAFERNGAVDLDAREAEWRQGGWTGVDPDATPAPGERVAGTTEAGGTAGLAAMQSGGSGQAAAATERTTAAATGADLPAGDGVSGAEAVRGTAAGTESIPVVEERLRVGKRDVTHGRVRVRSYVVETPVEEQVRLREEHVQVERRPVDRPLTGAEAAFQDRVIEATETAEEAVAEKEARIREEVVIRKEATERTETVSDTVRRTEVEVEDERTRAAGTTPRNPER